MDYLDDNCKIVWCQPQWWWWEELKENSCYPSNLHMSNEVFIQCRGCCSRSRGSEVLIIVSVLWTPSCPSADKTLDWYDVLKWLRAKFVMLQNLICSKLRDSDGRISDTSSNVSHINSLNNDIPYTQKDFISRKVSTVNFCYFRCIRVLISLRQKFSKVIKICRGWHKLHWDSALYKAAYSLVVIARETSQCQLGLISTQSHGW